MPSTPCDAAELKFGVTRCRRFVFSSKSKPCAADSGQVWGGHPARTSEIHPQELFPRAGLPGVREAEPLVLWQGCQELDRDSHKSSFECSCQVVGSGARVAPMRLLKDVNERTEDCDGGVLEEAAHRIEHQVLRKLPPKHVIPEEVPPAVLASSDVVQKLPRGCPQPGSNSRHWSRDSAQIRSVLAIVGRALPTLANFGPRLARSLLTSARSGRF